MKEATHWERGSKPLHVPIGLTLIKSIFFSFESFIKTQVLRYCFNEIAKIGKNMNKSSIQFLLCFHCMAHGLFFQFGDYKKSGNKFIPKYLQILVK
jgi:hypothetical protein